MRNNRALAQGGEAPGRPIIVPTGELDLMRSKSNGEDNRRPTIPHSGDKRKVQQPAGRIQKGTIVRGSNIENHSSHRRWISTPADEAISFGTIGLLESIR